MVDYLEYDSLLSAVVRFQGVEFIVASAESSVECPVLAAARGVDGQLR